MANRGNPYQKADGYTKRARERGFPARSVFKLEDIDRRARLLRPGMHVLDLGAAPGSWTMYAAEQGRPAGPRARDRSLADHGRAPGQRAAPSRAMRSRWPTTIWRRSRRTTSCCPTWRRPPPARARTDAIRSAALVERAIAVADALAKPGSALVAKLFMGGEYDAVRALIRERYATLKTLRPDGVRAHSVEVFLVATGRRA